MMGAVSCRIRGPLALASGTAARSVPKEDRGEGSATDRILVKEEKGASRAVAEASRRDVSVVDLLCDLPVEEAVEVYEDAPEVEYAEPDYLLAPSQTTTTNDPEYGKLYGLNNTGQNSGTVDAETRRRTSRRAA
jgi:hypothetical protein